MLFVIPVSTAQIFLHTMKETELVSVFHGGVSRGWTAGVFLYSQHKMGACLSWLNMQGHSNIQCVDKLIGMCGKFEIEKEIKRAPHKIIQSTWQCLIKS